MLSELLKKETFHWTEDYQGIVEDLKKKIKKENHLNFPDFTRKYILECDASNLGIGAVLYQKNGIVGYFSKKLNSTEMNYFIVEKEMFAIIRAVIHFKELIQGYYIVIYTDSRNCTFLKKDLSSRMNRWILSLNGNDFKIMGIECILNAIVDTLSRTFVLSSCHKKADNFKKLINGAISQKEIHLEE